MMTLDEMGRKLKRSPQALGNYSPKELDAIDDGALALMVLEQHPHYWDMLSPGVRKLRELARRDPKLSPLWDLLPGTWKAGHAANVRDRHDREAAAVAATALRTIALQHGLDLDTYLAWRRKELGLDVNPGRPLTAAEEELRLKVLLWEAEIRDALMGSHAKRVMEDIENGRSGRSQPAVPRDDKGAMAPRKQAKKGRPLASAWDEDGKALPHRGDGGRDAGDAERRGKKGARRDTRRAKPGEVKAPRAARTGDAA